ncbi:MAG TPA: hypothetical protein VLR44_07900, partial [Rhodoferax sp.]|nr:hypothetical protein [Rhodoferax sp.]
MTLRIASLADYGDLELMQVLVLDKDETAADMALGCGLPPARLLPELIETHDHWCELTFVTGQDGSGLVVYVPASAHELL